MAGRSRYHSGNVFPRAAQASRQPNRGRFRAARQVSAPSVRLSACHSSGHPWRTKSTTLDPRGFFRGRVFFRWRVALKRSLTPSLRVTSIGAPARFRTIKANASRTWLFVAGQNTLEEAYTRYVCDLARYYRRSPELISYEEVTGWLYHLIKERPLPLLQRQRCRQRRALSLRRDTWARDG